MRHSMRFLQIFAALLLVLTFCTSCASLDLQQLAVRQNPSDLLLSPMAPAPQPTYDISYYDGIRPEVVFDTFTPAAAFDPSLPHRVITPGEDDLQIIPDRYNTGCDESLLSSVRVADTVSGIYYGGSDTDISISLYAAQNSALKSGGTVMTENADFSSYECFKGVGGTVLIGEGNELVLIYKNCRFNRIQIPRDGSVPVKYIFENCTLNMFDGSNASFDCCAFRGYTYHDGMNPFQNVTVTNSFMYEKCAVKYDSEMHTDGVQIYGTDTLTAKNLHFDNLRVELPPVLFTESKAYVNTPLMISLDYNNAEDISFTNCVVNGGGISVTLYDNPKHKTPGYRMTGIVLDDIRVGTMYQYGMIAYALDNSVKGTDTAEKDVGATPSLYVASVWKADGALHLSTTNDTSLDRVMLVHTDRGDYTYKIPACKVRSQILVDDAYTDFPFDYDITVPCDASYAVCYDITEGEYRQIRLYNSTPDTPVMINESFFAEIELDPTRVIARGSGVENKYKLTWEVTADGILYITGRGATANWSMSGDAGRPFSPYKDIIRKAVLGEGVTTLGNSFLYNMPQLEQVVLPSTCTYIGDYSLNACPKLKDITIPYGVTRIGGYAFRGCSSLESIVIPSSVTALSGIQMFSGCTALKEAVVAADVTALPGSMFDGCTALKTIWLPCTVESIGGRCFYRDTALTAVKFTGTDARRREIAFPEGEAESYHKYFYQADTVTVTEEALYSFEDRACSLGKPVVPVLEITADTMSKIYDGTPTAPYSPFFTDSDGAVTVSYRSGARSIPCAPTEPGIYTVVIETAETENFFYSRTAQLFTITKQPGVITCSAESLDKSCDGTPVVLPEYHTNSEAPVKIQWTHEGILLAGPPVNSGNYTLTLSVEETSRYTAAAFSLDFTVYPAYDAELASHFAGGAGTAESPYIINTAQQLRDFASLVSSGTSVCGAYVRLGADIALNDVSEFDSWTQNTTGLDTWTPVGTEAHPFYGGFDGAGHTVTGMYIRDTSLAYSGLFGHAHGIVKGLVVEKAYVYGQSGISCIIGKLDGMLEMTDCHAVSCRLYSTSNTGSCGGLIGTAAPSGSCDIYMADCSFSGVLSGRNAAGGLCGTVTSGVKDVTVLRCTANLTMTTKDGGGMFHSLSNTGGKVLTECSVYGTVTGGFKVGGFMQNGSGPITFLRCQNHASVTVNTQSAGGFVAMDTANYYIDCINYGSVSMTGTGSVGGFAGTNSSNKCPRFYGCKNYGSIIHTGSDASCCAGGFVGKLSIGYSNTLAYHCTNLGTVTVTSDISAGGFAGLFSDENSSKCALDSIVCAGVVHGTASASKCGILFGTVTAVSVKNTYSGFYFNTALGRAVGKYISEPHPGFSSAIVGTDSENLAACVTALNLAVEAQNMASDRLTEYTRWYSGCTMPLSAEDCLAEQTIRYAYVTIDDSVTLSLLVPVSDVNADHPCTILCTAPEGSVVTLTCLAEPYTYMGTEYFRFCVRDIPAYLFGSDYTFALVSDGTVRHEVSYSLVKYASNTYKDHADDALVRELAVSMAYLADTAQKAHGDTGTALAAFCAATGYIPRENELTEKFFEARLNTVTVTPCSGTPVLEIALSLYEDIRPIVRAEEPAEYIKVLYCGTEHTYTFADGVAYVECLFATGMNRSFVLTVFDAEDRPLYSTEYSMANYLSAIGSAQPSESSDIKYILLAQATVRYLTAVRLYSDAVH